MDIIELIVYPNKKRKISFPFFVLFWKTYT
nr:hypothetical protein [Mucilaginibacter sp. FT3.2]